MGAATTVYVTDADNREVLEYDGTTGAVRAWYAYGLGSGEPLNRMDVSAGSRQTLIPDAQGSIVSRLDSASGMLTTAGYGAYGENPAQTTAGPGYTAQRHDPETQPSTAEASGPLLLPRQNVLADPRTVPATRSDRHQRKRHEPVCLCRK